MLKQRPKSTETLSFTLLSVILAISTRCIKNYQVFLNVMCEKRCKITVFDEEYTLIVNVKHILG